MAEVWPCKASMAYHHSGYVNDFGDAKLEGHRGTWRKNIVARNSRGRQILLATLIWNVELGSQATFSGLGG